MDSSRLHLLLDEISSGENFGYLLKDSSVFSATEYKVLHSQSQDVVPCMKMLYNGKDELYYLSSPFRSLASIAGSISKTEFVVIAKNLLAAVLNIKNNGFLNCANLNIDFSKVYVDYQTKAVKLIYIPVKTGVFSDYAAFENEFRANFLSFVVGLPKSMPLGSFEEKRFAQNVDLMEFQKLLVDRTLSLEEIAHVMDMRYSDTTAVSASLSCKIVGVNTPVPITLEVDCDRYRIGRNPDLVNGLVSFSKSISRKHCEITRENGSFYIADLESMGGTTVNGTRLVPKKPHPIANGDEITLANYLFKVILE